MRIATIWTIGVVAVTWSLADPIVGAEAPAPGKIGVVSQERVLNESLEGKRLNAELQKLRASKMAAIDAKEKEIGKLQDQLLNAQATLSDDKRDDIARQIKRKRVEYERLNDDAGTDFQEAAGRAQARLISIFRDLVAKYGAEKGFTVIVEKGTVYFASDSVDITDELLARFNAAVPPGAPAQPNKK